MNHTEQVQIANLNMSIGNEAISCKLQIYTYNSVTGQISKPKIITLIKHTFPVWTVHHFTFAYIEESEK